MAITLERQSGRFGIKDVWKVSDGFTVMQFTEEDLRDLVRQALDKLPDYWQDVTTE